VILAIMQEFDAADEEDVPSACPSYTEASIVDQAVPFIIFLSRYSKLKDRLSAADGLDSELATWRERFDARQSLLLCLDKQLSCRQQDSQTWQRFMLPKVSLERRQQASQTEIAELEAKKIEVTKSAEQCQAKIDLIVQAVSCH
jgi:hypothetical protein